MSVPASCDDHVDSITLHTATHPQIDIADDSYLWRMHKDDDSYLFHGIEEPEVSDDSNPREVSDDSNPREVSDDATHPQVLCCMVKIHGTTLQTIR